MYERYLAIYHHLEGLKNKEISKIIQRNEHTVGNYIKAYKKDGLEGLNLKHSPGTPKKLTDKQEELLIETITTKTPDEVGFPAKKNWTAVLIKEWIYNTFAVKYSERGTRDLLYRLNLSYTRPTYTLAKADKKEQENFRQKFEDTKKN